MKSPLKMKLSTRSAWTGALFISPFIIGFLVFFLRPLIQSLIFVFSDITVEFSGYKTSFSGMNNLYYIFKENTDFTGDIIMGTVNLFWKIPVIIISALFFAIILNQKFRGRTVVRAVFFLPAIISSGIVLSIIQSDAAAGSVMAGNIVAGGHVTQTDVLQRILTESGLSENIIRGALTVVNGLFNLMWMTGIQMIIFLAGLQGISPSLYEASSIEGATPWENFWKITMPMLIPILMLNLIYSIIDSFTDPKNAVMVQVINSGRRVKFGWASAMSWVYTVVIAVIIGIVILLFKKANENMTEL